MASKTKYGGISRAMAAKQLGAKASELITLQEAANVKGNKDFRTRKLLISGKVAGRKVQEAQHKVGKWYTTVASCKAYQATKGKRQDGMTTVLVRMPYDEALAFATKNKNATLRYNRKK